MTYGWVVRPSFFFPLLPAAVVSPSANRGADTLLLPQLLVVSATVFVILDFRWVGPFFAPPTPSQLIRLRGSLHPVGDLKKSGLVYAWFIDQPESGENEVDKLCSS